MLRGVSLAPQQRPVKDTQELPAELFNSIIGVTAHPSPDYGTTGNSGAASLSTAAQQPGASPASLPASAAPSFMTRMFRFARRRYQTTIGGQVPVFDANGNLTTSQTGVNMFRFRSLSLFYFFRAQPWTALITYSILLYLLIVLLITVAYYLWGMYCGAGMNMVASIYFTVVSLAANGGYLGEDVDTMTDSTHMCYRGRTVIVMVCSYVNIVFVGLVAALVVGKAEYTGKLGHRVVFSEFCTLTSIPGRVGHYRLNFRMANVDNNIPLAHGKLRLFCVTAEPLREYRMRQKQLHLLKNSAPLKALAKTTYGSAQQLLPGGEATSSLRGNAQNAPHLTAAMLEERRAAHQRHHHLHPQQQHKHRSTARAASGNEKKKEGRHPSRQRHPHRRGAQKGRHVHSSGGAARHASAADVAGAGSGSRGHHSSPRGSQRPATGAEETKGRRRHHHDRERDDHPSDCSSPPSSGTATRTSTPSSSSRSGSSHSSRSSSASSSSSSGSREKSNTKVSSPAGGKAGGNTAGGRDGGSDITNSSMTSKANSDLYAASPIANLAGSFAGPAGNKRVVSPATMPALRADSGTVRVHDEDDAEHEMERVHLRVQEMRWACAEESYLDHGDSGQLSLWYPATITHTIDERSPLYAFMQQPVVAASLREGLGAVFSGSTRSEESSVHPASLQKGPNSARHRFQLVAVFDATEMESGSTITAKHTYTTVDIVAHYKFSDRLVHMQPESGEVMLDFHYFNALLPIDLIELSTTDSDL